MELKIGMRVRVTNPKTKHYGKVGHIMSFHIMKGKYPRVRVKFRNQTTNLLTLDSVKEDDMFHDGGAYE